MSGNRMGRLVELKKIAETATVRNTIRDAGSAIAGNAGGVVGGAVGAVIPIPGTYVAGTAAGAYAASNAFKKIFDTISTNPSDFDKQYINLANAAAKEVIETEDETAVSDGDEAIYAVLADKMNKIFNKNEYAYKPLLGPFNSNGDDFNRLIRLKGKGSEILGAIKDKYAKLKGDGTYIYNDLSIKIAVAQTGEHANEGMALNPNEYTNLNKAKDLTIAYNNNKQLEIDSADLLAQRSTDGVVYVSQLHNDLFSFRRKEAPAQTGQSSTQQAATSGAVTGGGSASPVQLEAQAGTKLTETAGNVTYNYTINGPLEFSFNTGGKQEKTVTPSSFKKWNDAANNLNALYRKTIQDTAPATAAPAAATAKAPDAAAKPSEAATTDYSEKEVVLGQVLQAMYDNKLVGTPGIDLVRENRRARVIMDGVNLSEPSKGGLGAGKQASTATARIILTQNAGLSGLIPATYAEAISNTGFLRQLQVAINALYDNAFAWSRTISKNNPDHAGFWERLGGRTVSDKAATRIVGGYVRSGLGNIITKRKASENVDPRIKKLARLRRLRVRSQMEAATDDNLSFFKSAVVANTSTSSNIGQIINDSSVEVTFKWSGGETKVTPKGTITNIPREVITVFWNRGAKTEFNLSRLPENTKSCYLSEIPARTTGRKNENPFYQQKQKELGGIPIPKETYLQDSSYMYYIQSNLQDPSVLFTKDINKPDDKKQWTEVKSSYPKWQEFKNNLVALYEKQGRKSIRGIDGEEKKSTANSRRDKMRREVFASDNLLSRFGRSRVS